jgi:3-dehydroquinate dehydratase II
MLQILIINGPNLNLTGKRETDIYGKKNFPEYLSELKIAFNKVELNYFQSNIEGELINKLHEVGFSFDGIVFNPGGYSHTSVALSDAIAAISTPVIEVHLSNIYARESYRHISLTAAKSLGVISGFGMDSYKMAISHFIKS